MHPTTSSGQKNASAQILGRSGYLHALEIDTPSTGVTTLVVYDSANSSVAGKIVLASLEQYAGETCRPIVLHSPVIANDGIYCVLSGTASTYVVHYTPS